MGSIPLRGHRNRSLWNDEEVRMDAEIKTIAYRREMAEWLWGGCLEVLICRVVFVHCDLVLVLGSSTN